MKIKYEFATETIEIEVDDKLGKIIMAMNLAEESRQRTTRNHEVIFDPQNDYNTWLATKDTSQAEERDMEIRSAFNQLSKKQSELVEALYGPEPITAKEYAKREGVSHTAIKCRKKVIIKKLKKLL